MKWMWVVSKSVCFFVLASVIAWAQGNSSISGVVKDPHGAIVPGATVTLVSRDNTTSLRAVSDQSGHYRFAHLSPGLYLLSATAKSLESSAVQTIDTTAGAQTGADLQLRLVAITTSVTVTGSGTAQTTDETAKSVSVVDSETIQSLDMNTVADALSYVPGLRIEQQGGPGGLVSIKTRGLRNQDTAVLVDGFRLRDASGTQADASSLLQDLLITNVDRIEVLRGTGSSIYGTDATGGVINIITGAGGGKTRGTILLEGGSMTTFRGRAGVSGSTLNGKLGYSAGIAHLNVVNGLDGNLPDRTSGVQTRLDYALSNHALITARFFALDSFSRMTQSPEALSSASSIGVTKAVALSASQLRLYENGTPLSKLDLGNATFISDYDDPDDSRAARTYSGVLTASTHPTDSLSLIASYQGLSTHRNYTNGPLGIGDYQPYGGTEVDLYDGLIHTVSGRMNWRLGKYQSINAGYEFENEHYQEQTTEPTAPKFYSTDVTQRYQAIFLQDQLHLASGRLQLAGSYRGQFFDLENPALVPASSNPYTGVKLSNPPTSNTWDASSAYLFRESGTKLRAHVGTGYRAPSLYERFGTYFSSYGNTYEGDPIINPERSTAVDGGVDQSLWNRRAEVSATYFYTRLHDVIAYGSVHAATDPFGRSYGYYNTKGGIARGAEASFAVTPVRRLNLRTAYTFTNARETKPTITGIYQTFKTPDHQFSVLATGQLTPSLSVVFGTVLSSTYMAPIYNSTTYASQAFRFDGFRKGQLGANYRRPLGEQRSVRLFVNVNNAFNQSYYESGCRTPDATAMSGVQFDF
jgi:iron complex outermembrane receptor protein